MLFINYFVTATLRLYMFFNYSLDNINATKSFISK